MLHAEIHDGSNGLSAGVSKENGDPCGVVAYTRPLHTLDAAVKFATNESFGFNLNQNAAFSGTPLGVHNGTDNIYWTASALSGSWVFDSITQAQAGTKSIDATGTTNNNEALLSTSNIDSADYTALTGWIYIGQWSDRGSLKEVEIEFRLNGVLVGNSINLSTYVNEFDFDTWQKFTIPLTAFSSENETVNQIRIRTRDVGGGPPPDYFLDSIQLEEVGVPIVYEVIPDADYGYIESITVVVADNVTTLSYDSFLGVSMNNGITVQSIRNGEEKFTSTIKTLGDLLQGQEIKNSINDGVNSFLTTSIQFNPPLPFNKATQDSFRVTVNDDLSSLLRLRYFLRVYA
tara:strand:+ start:4933 stop:5967 length:1035 start_codon:yes stop_codon:yes gene_type:complete